MSFKSPKCQGVIGFDQISICDIGFFVGQCISINKFKIVVAESGVVSSCEEGERIPLGSQASETNVPTASCNEEPSRQEIAEVSTCQSCKTKPAACRLKVSDFTCTVLSQMLFMYYFHVQIIVNVEVCNPMN